MDDLLDLGSEDFGSWPRDPKIEEAKKTLLAHFEANPRAVYYEHQLEVILERQFYHWITGKALHELIAEEKIASELMSLTGAVPIRFYHRKSHRGWRRQARQILEIVQAFSNEDFARGLGRHGELMVDAALPRIGFVRLARETRSHEGRTWTKTGHDLDRIYRFEDLTFGAEIKNRLSYMDLDDIKIKIEICRYLRLTPLFVVRMFPKSYFDFIYREGGISLILGHQLYPHGQHSFAHNVRDLLNLPVDSPAEIYDGTLSRLLKGISHFRKRQETFSKLLKAILALPRRN